MLLGIVGALCTVHCAPDGLRSLAGADKILLAIFTAEMLIKVGVG